MHLIKKSIYFSIYGGLELRKDFCNSTPSASLYNYIEFGKNFDETDFFTNTIYNVKKFFVKTFILFF